MTITPINYRVNKLENGNYLWQLAEVDLEDWRKYSEGFDIEPRIVGNAFNYEVSPQKFCKMVEYIRAVADGKNPQEIPELKLVIKDNASIWEFRKITAEYVDGQQRVGQPQKVKNYRVDGAFRCTIAARQLDSIILYLRKIRGDKEVWHDARKPK